MRWAWEEREPDSPLGYLNLGYGIPTSYLAEVRWFWNWETYLATWPLGGEENRRTSLH